MGLHLEVCTWGVCTEGLCLGSAKGGCTLGLQSGSALGVCTGGLCFGSALRGLCFEVLRLRSAFEGLLGVCISAHSLVRSYALVTACLRVDCTYSACYIFCGTISHMVYDGCLCSCIHPND